MRCRTGKTIFHYQIKCGWRMPKRVYAKVGQRSKLEIVMTKLRPRVKRIRLNLAPVEGFPSGSDAAGLGIRCALDAAGISTRARQKQRENCSVRRFWGDDGEQGHSRHKPGGAEMRDGVLTMAMAARGGRGGRISLGSHAFRQEKCHHRD